mmetsp:Transcript_4817/g.6888  ORF Transcript_4817/g.6888 Transcript_4817/m.6888 type:complete len:536 (-) Transcript_4817:270-1877(-)
MDEDDSEEGEMPDTSKDEELAKSLTLSREARNKDASGMKGKKIKALASLREERKASRGDKEDEDSVNLDYGDSNEDTDSSDYEPNEQPWKKTDSSSRKNIDANVDSSDEEVDTEDHSSSRSNGIKADYNDYLNVTIPRRRLARWCNEPFFEKAVKNFFVKLAIGKDKVTQKSCYRLCKIVEVKDDSQGSKYKFPPIKNEKPVTTNKQLKLQLGKSKRDFKMCLISDAAPTVDDISTYIEMMRNCRMENKLLEKKSAIKMRKEQDDLVNNYVYTKDDIEKSIQAKKKFRKTVGNIGAEKTRVAIAVQAAKEALAEAKNKINELERALLEANQEEEKRIMEDLENAKDTLREAEDNLERKRNEEMTVLEAEEQRKNRMISAQKVRNWAKVNERAKIANKKADLEAYKTEMERNGNGNSEKGFDPMKKRKVKPKILWEVGQDKDENVKHKTKGNPQDEAVKVRGDKNVFGSSIYKEHDQASIQKPKLLHQIQELALNEESLAQANAYSGALFGVQVKNRVRKGISLQEYQKLKIAGTM